ncbi:hypothetical protein MLD38_023888 [Melastoma candidum]|uniref:Uncharacterized protein n=1 Tax=Melastoma candidum TaxID=119954 RepID=A0ACB9NRL8_9MYRT|nr:hypothetical protein MLD38_023888 [Melastoma candidum]
MGAPAKGPPFIIFSLLSLLSLGVHVRSICNGSVGDCSHGGGMVEFMMDSEINTRMFLLEDRKYISLGALRKDQPVCGDGSSGDAYGRDGGCIPPPSNPYTRGCSKYYRCRSDS